MADTDLDCIGDMMHRQQISSNQHSAKKREHPISPITDGVESLSPAGKFEGDSSVGGQTTIEGLVNETTKSEDNHIEVNNNERIKNDIDKTRPVQSTDTTNNDVKPSPEIVADNENSANDVNIVAESAGRHDLLKTTNMDEICETSTKQAEVDTESDEASSSSYESATEPTSLAQSDNVPSENEIKNIESDMNDAAVNVGRKINEQICEQQGRKSDTTLLSNADTSTMEVQGVTISESDTELRKDRNGRNGDCTGVVEGKDAIMSAPLAEQEEDDDLDAPDDNYGEDKMDKSTGQIYTDEAIPFADHETSADSLTEADRRDATYIIEREDEGKCEKVEEEDDESFEMISLGDYDEDEEMNSPMRKLQEDLKDEGEKFEGTEPPKKKKVPTATLR